MNQRLCSYYPSHTCIKPIFIATSPSASIACTTHASHSVYNLRELGKRLNHMPFSCLFCCLCWFGLCEMFSRLRPCEIEALVLLMGMWNFVILCQKRYKLFFCDKNVFLIVITDCFLWNSRYSTSLYETWTETVGESSQYNLSLPLISRDLTTQLISVNFNPQVFTLQAHMVEKLMQDRLLDVSWLVKLFLWVGLSDLLVWLYIKLISFIKYHTLDCRHTNP